MPPILRLDIPEHRGEVDVKTAYVPGLDGFAIKVSPGFFDNPKLGLPSLNGLMVLFSATTGLVEALLLDNGYLTDVRTAAAGAVAAQSPVAAGGARRGDLRRRHAGAAAARGADARAADHARRGSGRATPRKAQTLRPICQRDLGIPVSAGGDRAGGRAPAPTSSSRRRRPSSRS